MTISFGGIVAGYYITCDDAVCPDHLPDPWEGFEDWTEPLAIFNDTEADTPTHCVECGCLIEHDLTEAGVIYVVDAILDDILPLTITWQGNHRYIYAAAGRIGVRNPVTTMWYEHYGPIYDLDEALIELIVAAWYNRKVGPQPWADKYAKHLEVQ